MITNFVLEIAIEFDLLQSKSTLHYKVKTYTLYFKVKNTKDLVLLLRITNDIKNRKSATTTIAGRLSTSV